MTRSRIPAVVPHSLDPALKLARDGLHARSGIGNRIHRSDCQARTREANQVGEHEYMFAKVRIASSKREDRCSFQRLLDVPQALRCQRKRSSLRRKQKRREDHSARGWNEANARYALV